MKMQIWWLLIIATLTAKAHHSGLSYLQLTQNNEAKISVVYKKPIQDIAIDDIFVRFPATCKRTTFINETFENEYIIKHYTLQCATHGLIDERIWVEGLVASDKGVWINFVAPNFSSKGMLTDKIPFLHLQYDKNIATTLYAYLTLGIEHILLGIDHLAFVLGLMLFRLGTRRLIYAVSAFTLSHSLTLGLSIFEIITVPTAFVEAMIALSIVILYREVIIENPSIKKGFYRMVFLFGLLHGLGFSSVLQDIGLPKEDAIPALFAFNVGIELGQLMFIATTTIFFGFLIRLWSNGADQVHRTIAYTIGSIATFWLIERIEGFVA